MPLIVMNREMGSLGKDVAYGLATALGLKVQHHEMIEHLANRARVRKSHVISFLEGSQGIIERLTIDQLKLCVLAADEIVSIAQRNEGVILRGWGATSLFKDVPHVVRICVSASRRQRVKRMMQRMDSSDEGQTERIVDQNDEAARAVMRRHFHIDVRDINEYDLGFNTDRVSVEQCIDQVIRTVNSPQFAESDASRAKLRDLAVMHHVRAALRTQALTSHCIVRVTSVGGQVRLEGVVDNSNEAKACSEIASRIKGVVDVDNRLNLSGVPARLRGP